MGIRLWDFIIVGDGYYSFADNEEYAISVSFSDL